MTTHDEAKDETVGRGSKSAGAGLADFMLFDNLDSAVRAAAEAACSVRTFAKNSLVVEYQSAQSNVYFLLEGRARVVIFADSGKEISFRDLDEGQFFGEFAALDNGPRSACVIATTDVRLIQMPQSVFRKLVFEQPAVLEPLLTHLIGLLRHYTNRVLEFVSLPVASRLHAELLRLVTQNDSAPTEEQARTAPLPTHAVLASRLGTHREAITRELSRLSAEGIIAVQRGQVTILDLDALSALVLARDDSAP